MKKLILILLIFLFISTASAGNNTTEIDDPTSVNLPKQPIEALESGDSNISFSNNFTGWCIEWGEHSAEEGEFFKQENTFLVNNSNYIKTMFLFFPNEVNKDIYRTQHMIWKFSDNKEFSRFDKDWYNQIIEMGNKYKIPDKGTIQLNSTHELHFEFVILIAQYEEYQNYFAYRFWVEGVNHQINKTSVNISIFIEESHYNFISQNHYNKSINKKDNISNVTSTLEKEKIEFSKHVCGIDLRWVWGWIVILTLMVLLLYKKED